MHEINNINKRLRTIKHFSNYFVVALVILVLSGLIVLAAQGYDIDRSTGQVIQNGILLVETEPSGAVLSINGRPESDRTSGKYPVPEGTYDLTLSKDGYRDWQTTAEVFGSKVNWIYYPRLIPETISTSTINPLDDLKFIAQNPDRDVIVTSSSSNVRSLSVYDIGANEIEPSQLVIPQSVFFSNDNVVSGTIDFVRWSSLGRYLLVRYSVNNQDDLVLIDLENISSSINLDRAYNLDFTDIVFTDNDSSVIGLSGGVVYELNLSTPLLGEPIANGVKSVFMNNNRIWLQRDTTDGSAFALLTDPTSPLVEREGEITTARVVDWDGVENMVIANDEGVFVYKDTTASRVENILVSKILKLDGYQRVTSSANGRFIALHAPKVSLVYDLENLRTYSIDIGTENSVAWLDDFRFYFELAGQLYIQDFNGSNSYQIAGFEKNYPAFVDSDFSAIYSTAIRSVDGQLVFRRSNLEL